MALRDVFKSGSDEELTSSETESRLPGEGLVTPDVAAELISSDESEDAPLMVLSQINEA